MYYILLPYNPIRSSVEKTPEPPYISLAIETLRNNGIHIPEEYIQHISPLGWEHIALTGDYIWNLNQKVNFENLRPLRKNRIKKK